MSDATGLGTVRWVDLGVRGMEVVLAEFAGSPGERAIVIRGDAILGARSEEALLAAGFRKFDGPRTVWARQGGSFRVRRDLFRAFPRVSLVEMPLSHTRAHYRGNSPFAAPIMGQDQGQPGVPPSPAASSTVPNVVDERKPNPFQNPYVPASKVGRPIAMIPVNMAEATAKALARIEDEHGPIDDFVADLLGMTVEVMGNALSPEQVDAIGMGIASMMRGRGFILADATGLGKGRVLASIALAGRRLGKDVVFITEKANLFSDFWRDITDIGAAEAFGTPFLLNGDSRIVDVNSVNGDVLFEAPKADVARKIIKSGRLPDGCHLGMSSYSQYNRPGSPKTKFLAAIADGALVIEDEVHNAMGDSNTAEALKAALSKAWGTVRSSATFAKQSIHLLSYGDVLPPSMRKDNPEDLLATGGNVLAEALSQSLAEDGILLRREHDDSGIERELVVDTERAERNSVYQDALAPILSRMAKLSRLVKDEAESRNEDNKQALEGMSGPGRKGARENWYTSPFGTRMAPLKRQFLTALSVDLCVERAVRALLNGQRPVIKLESTMESLMRELAADLPAGDDVATEEGILEDAISDDGTVDEAASEDGKEPPGFGAGAPAPDFRAALRVMLDRIMTLSVKRNPKDDPERFPVEDPFCVSAAEEIRRLIDDFPDLSLSPIDDIREGIEREGRRLFEAGKIKRPWRIDEISARKLRVVNGVYEMLPTCDRNAVVAGFQSGGIDGVIMTRAASTGLSLHASEKALDQNQRNMITVDPAADPVVEWQGRGRVNRRGQVRKPRYETLCTGLPSHMRMLANENRKHEALNANVAANAADATKLDVPDPMDSVGNAVARRILEDRPRLAEEMCIAMRVDPEQAEQDLYFVSKFLQYIDLLPHDEGRAAYELLLAEYADEVAAMKARGQSPRGLRELAGEWREVSREPYEAGDPADGPVFGRAVDLVTMEAAVERASMDAAAVRGIIAESRRRLGDSSGNAAGPFFEHEARSIKASRRKVLTAALSGRLVSVDSALKMNGPNAVKAADERMSGLLEALRTLQPGVTMAVPGEEGEIANAVVVDVRAPAPEELHLPGRWGVRYVVPGDAHPREVSIATIMRDKSYMIHPARPGDIPQPNLAPFDNAPRGEIVERRVFLDGNLVKAVIVASECSAGSTVTFRDTSGNARRAVLVSRRGFSSLFDRSKSTTDVSEAYGVLTSGRQVWTNPQVKSEGLVIRLDGTGPAAFIEIPKGKAGKAFETERLLRVCGAFRQGKDCRAARVQGARIAEAIEAVLDDGHPLHFKPPPKPRPLTFAQRRQQQARQQGPGSRR